MEPPAPSGSPLVSTRASVPALSSADHRARRWRLFRDLLVFQAKLLVDGLKDLVFAPIALVAALVGLLAHRDDPGRPFYTLLRWGHGFDRWVNLFGTHRARALPPAPGAPPPGSSSTTAAPEPDDAPPHSSTTIDSHVDRVEQVLVDQYRRGGLTAKAKDAIDKALDSLHERPPR